MYSCKHREAPRCQVPTIPICSPVLISPTLTSVTPRQVAGTFYTYLELKECRPRLRRLDRLLAAEPYRGRLSPGRGYSRAQLAEAVQASHAQLDTALRESHAMLMDGERGKGGVVRAY